MPDNDEARRPGKGAAGWKQTGSTSEYAGTWQAPSVSARELAAGLRLRKVGAGWRGPCPIHGGTSFTLSERGGRPVWTCWSGCDRGAILTELRARGLWPERSETPEQREQRRRAWAEQRRLTEEAEAWQRAAVLELEGRQAAALEKAEKIGRACYWFNWGEVCADTYSLRRLSGDALLKRFAYEKQARPAETSRRLADDRQDRREATALVRAIVAMLAVAQERDGRAAA